MNREKNNTQYDGKIAGLYDLGDTLGRGHFAVVKLAKHVFTGEQVAVKVIDKSKLDDVSREHLFQEVRCMKLVQHPNVVRLYEVIDTHTKLYLILEFGDGGDMYDYIMKHEKGVDEESAKKYFKQIVHAISYCHKLHVVHRDLKPENVVFFEKLGMVKLTDFGFSNKFCPGQKLETSCGSLAYSAPEILLGDSYDAPKVDVWSLGVILYMMVCGHAPFQEANDSETLTMIMDCKYTIPAYVSLECKSLIQRMLIRDPDKRATLENITKDSWLNEDNALQPYEYLPLISREHISEDDHAHIIQKMINGNIATKEAILEALDKNEYNHITATYFLLAERKLRVQRQEKAQLMNFRSSRTDLSPVAIISGVTSAIPSPAQEKPSIDNLLSPMNPIQSLEVTNASNLLSLAPLPMLPLARKCSIVREEDDSGSTISTASSPSKSPVNPKPPSDFFKAIGESSDDNSINLSIPLPSIFPRAKSPSGSSSSPKSKLVLAVPHGRRLHSVHSSPQLPLNEINEESSETLNSKITSNTNNTSSGNIRNTHNEKVFPLTEYCKEPRSGVPSQCKMMFGEDKRADQIEKFDNICPKINEDPVSSLSKPNFLAESTDSLDFLSDGQPRLMNSISCGDLTADTSVTKKDGVTACQTDKPASRRCEVNKKKKVYDLLGRRHCSSEKCSRVTNSVSVNTGLSTLQISNGGANRGGHCQDSNSNLLKMKLNRLVTSSSKTDQTYMDNGWKKTSENKRGHRSRNNQVMDVKMASKCCTLC